MENLDEKLRSACKAADLHEICTLLQAGANPNLTDESGRTIFDRVFQYAWYNSEDLHTDGFLPHEALQHFAQTVKTTLKTIADSGIDKKKYWLSIMRQFVLFLYDPVQFDIMAYALEHAPQLQKTKYKSLLESIATEESYQRCCEENHALENLFYAMYELVAAKADRKDPRAIDLYHKAVGKKITEIFYLGDEDSLRQCEHWTEFEENIVLQCEDFPLVMHNGIHLMVDRNVLQSEACKCMPDLFGVPILGARITDVSFRHRKIEKENNLYGQPAIVLSLDKGIRLCFTHNFGELPDREVQYRFYVISAE